MIKNKYSNYVIHDNLIDEYCVNDIMKGIFKDLDSLDVLGFSVIDVTLDTETLLERVLINDDGKYYVKPFDVVMEGGNFLKNHAFNVLLHLSVLTSNYTIIDIGYTAVKLGPYRDSEYVEYGSAKELMKEKDYIDRYSEYLLKNLKNGYGFDNSGKITKMSNSKLLVYKNIEDLKKLRLIFKKSSVKSLYEVKQLLGTVKPELKNKVKSRMDNNEISRRSDYLKNNLPSGYSIKTVIESDGVFYYRIKIPNGDILELGTNFLYIIKNSKDNKSKIQNRYSLDGGNTIDEAVLILNEYNIEFLSFIGKLIDGRRNPLK